MYHNNKGKKPSALAFLLVMALAFGYGCSIKEDRSRCPCSLVLDFSGVDISSGEMMEIRITAPDGFLYYDGDAVSGISYTDSGPEPRPVYNVTVPKSMLGISVVRGSEGLFSTGAGISIPLGCECPPVFMHYSGLDAFTERREDKVVLHKDHCNVVIRMLAGGADYPFRLTVEGNVCGISPDRSVVPGDFSYDFQPDTEGLAKVRVPRQTDNSLVLAIRDGDEVLREFALGEFIAEAGYDWTADDLEDVEVSIDYAHSEIRVDIAEWSGTFSYEVVI